MPAAFPQILKRDGLFSDAEVKQISDAMGSDQIKNLVKEEAGKLAVEGGSFGFVSLALVRRRSKASFGRGAHAH